MTAARPDLSGVRLVSWDVDGTLYRPLVVRLAIGVRFGAACLAGRGPRLYRAVAAFRQARARLDRQRGRPPMPLPPVDPARAEFEDELLLPSLAAVGPRAGVADLLAALSGRGLVQVAFSDYPAEDKIRALGLAGCFAACYAGETAGAPKPSPAILLAIARDFSVTPAQMIHIGDRTDTDGAAAAAFGCRSLILGRDFRDFRSLARTLGG